MVQSCVWRTGPSRNSITLIPSPKRLLNSMMTVSRTLTPRGACKVLKLARVSLKDSRISSINHGNHKGTRHILLALDKVLRHEDGVGVSLRHSRSPRQWSVMKTRSAGTRECPLSLCVAKSRDSCRNCGGKKTNSTAVGRLYQRWHWVTISRRQVRLC